MKKVAAAFVLAFIIALMLSCAASLCHGAVRSKSNSLGVLISMDNPNTSIVGTIIAGESHTDKDGRMGIAVRIHPIKTYNLYDVTIMFCGAPSIEGGWEDVLSKLTVQDGDKYYFYPGPNVFTYKREVARMINGVPCYQLVDANRIILPPGINRINP